MTWWLQLWWWWWWCLLWPAVAFEMKWNTYFYIYTSVWTICLFVCVCVCVCMKGGRHCREKENKTVKKNSMTINGLGTESKHVLFLSLYYKTQIYKQIYFVVCCICVQNPFFTIPKSIAKNGRMRNWIDSNGMACCVVFACENCEWQKRKRRSSSSSCCCCVVKSKGVKRSVDRYRHRHRQEREKESPLCTIEEEVRNIWQKERSRTSYKRHSSTTFPFCYGPIFLPPE